MLPSVPDQRRSKRFALQLPVELIRAASTPITRIETTKNLSSGGVLFTSDSQMDVGEPIEYCIVLPSGQKSGEDVRLRCLGKVVRLELAATDGESPSKRFAVAATVERYEFIRRKAKVNGGD